MINFSIVLFFVHVQTIEAQNHFWVCGVEMDFWEVLWVKYFIFGIIKEDIMKTDDPP